MTSENLFSLEGRTAIITGGSRGLGREMALAFAEHGANVVIASRKIENCERVAQEVRDRGQRSLAVSYHAASWSDADRLASEAIAEFGTIDILVNNPLEDFPADAFERLLQTNIASVFHVGQAVARHMIARGRGKIINIASVQTALARPSIAPYTATKGAVGNLTKGMATDWAKHGLNCNAIAPGYFDTPLNAALVADPAFSAWLEKRTPAGRWGKVEELQGACIFLASDAASFVNGHILYVDGGITASL